MGLDVYLYHAANLEAYKKNETRISEIESDLWVQAEKIAEDAHYNSPYFRIKRKLKEENEQVWSQRYYDLKRELSEEETAEYEKMRSIVYEHFQSLCDANPELNIIKQQNVEEHCLTSVEFPSEQHPDHYYKVGYFRSSYNSGGINSVARKFGLPGLYEILCTDDSDDYYVKPNWVNSLVKVQSALVKWREHAEKVGNYRVIVLDPTMIKSAEEYDKNFKAPCNEGQALDMFLKNVEESSKLGNYSSREGEFFLTPSSRITLKALMPGYCDSWRGNTLGVYAICEVENAEGKKESPLEYYLQALEIVQETIAYVLAQPDPENYVLAWSS